MAEQSRVCFKCGEETTGERCPRCGGGRLKTKGAMRALGAVQLLAGLFLVGLMGTITYNLAPQLLAAGVPTPGGGRFTGTPEQGLMILGLFGLVITFGLGSTASGLWQITTARRNRWLFVLMLALFVVVMLYAWFTTAQLKAAERSTRAAPQTGPGGPHR